VVKLSREQSPDSIKAFKEWDKSGRTTKPSEIAAKLGLSATGMIFLVSAEELQKGTKMLKAIRAAAHLHKTTMQLSTVSSASLNLRTRNTSNCLILSKIWNH
jgi:hypothetical protein